MGSWEQFLVLLLAGAGLVASLTASTHALLTKRDSRSIIAWVGVVWLSPLVGSFLYLWLGINRIERKAKRLRLGNRIWSPPADDDSEATADLQAALGPDRRHLASIPQLIGRITQLPLLSGNSITPLENGDAAFPAMLDAIENAAQSIALSTYIFDNDSIGQQFASALKRAHERGVKVRVIIDDMGSRYSWTKMPTVLRRHGIPCATFIPTLVPWTFHYSNLRTHRKLLVVDGRVGFTGGVNIREGHRLQSSPRHPIADLHFKLEGPVTAQLQDVFVDDWYFSTGEILEGEAWFPTLSSSGSVPKGTIPARAIPDGPDERLESFHLSLMGAIAAAENTVRVVTPYFLPDSSLITALNVAALRGIEVDIVLPDKNNIPVVNWASTAMIRQVIERGCRVWISPPPFDHTKLMIVDDVVIFFGSSNWDPRSLRLNFELNVECYSLETAAGLTRLIESKIANSQAMTLESIDAMPIWKKLRNGLAALGSPYL
ncbi:MAG: phospholipase D-like domain-containing protein [Pirellulales bacterium]